MRPLEAALAAYVHERPWLRLLTEDDLVLSTGAASLD
jgi:hypothetical protein